MQFTKIKDDGTLYHVDVRYVSGSVARVIDMGRIWHEYSAGSRTTLTLAPEHVTKPGNRDSHQWSTRSRLDGILVVVAERASMTEELAALDTASVRTASRETAAQALEEWRASLPKGMRVTVATSREIKSTWEDYKAKCEQKRTEYAEQREQWTRAFAQAAESEARVKRALEPYAVRPVYGDPPAHKSYITLDADQLSALLGKLDPQWVLDAVADHLMEIDIAGLPESVIHEIRGCADTVRRQILEEIETSTRT